MILDRGACEWLALEITTDPVTTPTQWEATFDDEVTWVAASDIGGNSAWLIAGPDYAGTSTPDFTTANSTTTTVKVRLIDDPETVIRHAAKVTTKNL